jgi:glyoxylate/hydroxypyruvate/2-ketogluconate reductase
MKPKLVISRRIFPAPLALLQQHFEVVDNEPDLLLSPEQLVARCDQAQALFVVSSDKVDANFVAQTKQVKIIATGSVGTNHIDLTACKGRGIVVTNTPDVLTEATADMAWALLMSAARRVTEAERWLRAGHWDRWAFDQFLGATVHGATLGIVGMGRIGSAIAKRARGFDMKICYHNRSKSAEADLLGARYLSKEEILREADFLMLVLPYNPANHHWLDSAALQTMKTSAIVINIARGGIVDDSALASALASKAIAGAGLDVFEGEPQLNPNLLSCDNIVLTPHIGSATAQTRDAMAMLAAQNLVRWAQNKALITPVAV